jgi:hypothetical protein
MPFCGIPCYGRLYGGRPAMLELSKSVILKQLPEDYFLCLDSETGKQYDLTEIEFFILNTINNETVTIQDIASRIENRFQVRKAENVQQDISNFVKQLKENGLLK